MNSVLEDLALADKEGLREDHTSKFVREAGVIVILHPDHSDRSLISMAGSKT
jgi:ketol-acid reductoisomerase